MATYWAYQTLTTVGYGDFGCNNVSEILITLVWMLIGVAFYSFVLGSLTAIITSIKNQSDNLNNKLKALENFAKETDLDPELWQKLR